MPAAWANISMATCMVPYTPDEAYLISLGRFLASATKSATVFQGASFLITRIVGSAVKQRDRGKVLQLIRLRVVRKGRPPRA